MNALLNTPNEEEQEKILQQEPEHVFEERIDSYAREAEAQLMGLDFPEI